MTSKLILYILLCFLIDVIERTFVFFLFIRKTCTDVPDKLLIFSRKKDIRVRQLLAKDSLNEFDMARNNF